METIKCICHNDYVLSEDVVKENLSEKEYQRLERIRMSRKIDKNPNGLWCPNLKCQKDMERKGKEVKVQCSHCE